MVAFADQLQAAGLVERVNGDQYTITRFGANTLTALLALVGAEDPPPTPVGVAATACARHLYLAAKLTETMAEMQEGE